VKSRSWYRVAVATKTGTPQLLLAGGEHMGQAIADAAKELSGWPIAVDPATTEEIPLGESVGKGHFVKLGDAPSTLSTFAWPAGALPATAGGTTGVRRGWIERTGGDLCVLEAQTEHDHLVDLYLGLIERLPSADNLEIRLLDHFEGAGVTDVWLTSRVNAKTILRFLDDHDAELFGNGHVELSVYVRAHKATLRLTQHKTVVWLSEGRELAPEISRWFGALGLSAVTELPSVADGAHHHYRGQGSRDRKKLGDELFKQRLRKVDSIRAS
jgi:hypothetical protein